MSASGGNAHTRRTADEVRAALNGHGQKAVTLEAIRGDVTVIRRTRWAWTDWAPLGSFLVIAGEPAAGKGVMTCFLLANLTRGTAPGDLEGEPCNVMWVAFEDSWPEVILPGWLPPAPTSSACFTSRSAPWAST